MPTPRSDHLLDVARRLLARPAGAPRQAELRRAISTAYYAVFHEAMRAVAEHFVGRGSHGTVPFALAYRRLDHKALRACCIELLRPHPFPKLDPAGSLAGPGLLTFATALVELQEARHRADYDPLASFTGAEARAAIVAAQGAIDGLWGAGADARILLLTIVAFPSR